MSRLLIITRSHNPLGGADRIVADLCRELPSRGWQTILGLTRGASFDDPDAYRRVHRNLETIEIDGTHGTRAARLKSLRETIRKTSPNVVLSMRVFDAYQAVAQLKADDLSRAPRLAVGVRAYESAYISDVRRCCGNIDLCVTSGKLIAAACRQIGGMEEQRVESIAGGVHPPREAVSPKDSQSFNDQKPIRLLYAGRLEQQQKRALDLIPFTQALLALGIEFRLDICGAGPEEDRIADQLKLLIDNGQVTMHGWVDQAELYNRFYPNADCFVHFAAWEGVTISPREAMAHGVVPVVSEFTGMHAEGQFLNRINSLCFPVGHPEIAAQRVGELLSTPALLSQLSKSAMETQTGKYSHAGALDLWRDVLNQCLKLPAKVDNFPRIPERLGGRLSQWGVPSSLQLWLRRVLNKPVLHHAPGSEWPTASGLMSEVEQAEIAALAVKLEAETQLEPVA
ncbi:UDP-D-galactose:(glucosyl)lipopolysaccharide-1,6-D-galactosyltransferase [Novipirellula galeiformis]|uniref:UDP-D-galactose:(Glucosyl)lipopolysaccharide-1, 6-D-galactosyltransferase n=1 Tax=Novipirellula galeiformis TaxID=2528004 RepID=A0A5C6CQG4_9BACT|nr:glycosyltransferase family 4 protein [Novipirellula galeiformis]TWU27183.1 UDP-D-galactose:(glucosyl)lipopolysaccharide-1,6-D-galactosyltransferase [Novipirellula galeiformis]